jgi:hypothetical protein
MPHRRTLGPGDLLILVFPLALLMPILMFVIVLVVMLVVVLLDLQILDLDPGILAF